MENERESCANCFCEQRPIYEDEGYVTGYITLHKKECRTGRTEGLLEGTVVRQEPRVGERERERKSTYRCKQERV